MEYAERAENLRRTRVDTVCKFAEVMSMLDEDWKDDTRLVQQPKDFCKNGLLTEQLLLTDGEPTPTLYIADVARELEIKLQPGVSGRLACESPPQRAMSRGLSSTPLHIHCVTSQ
jgi:hypothetical protein